ncbi:hypothetical protein [Enterobacter cloacae complex sp. 277I4]|uniref:hypothetical protein n=1 Tax=Enterobacter cloacae complex sp. 277I4 TaxID=3395873 RepID=UPI003CF427E9
MIFIARFMNSFLHQASFATGYWCYDRHRSVRLVVLVGLANDQIAQSGRWSSLSVIDDSANSYLGLNQGIRLLSSTGEALQRLELHRASGFELLRQMLQNTIIRLENSDVTSSQTDSNLTDVALPVKAERQNSQRWVYVVNSEPAVEVEVIRKSASRVTPLVAYFGGILTAAGLGHSHLYFHANSIQPPRRRCVEQLSAQLYPPACLFRRSISYARTLRRGLNPVAIPTPNN